MESSFGLLFYLKKSKIATENGKHIYIRITVDGKIAEISTKRKCGLENWDVKAGRMKEKSDMAKSFNAYLDTLQQKVFKAKRKLIKIEKKLQLKKLRIWYLESITYKSTSMIWNPLFVPET